MFMQNVPDQVATNGIAKSESRLRRTWSNCEQVHPNSAVAICEIRKLTLFKRCCCSHQARAATDRLRRSSVQFRFCAAI